MQRNWIISNHYLSDVYVFLLSNHITFEPSGCFSDSTCIAAWNLSLQQAISVENYIISHDYGYCMDTVPLPVS